MSATMLNVGQMMGSGIYAVPGVMLNSVGSIGLLLAYWIIAPLFAFAGLTLYTELASMFPRRSGGEVAYLEQAYPRPRFLVSTAFAATAILMSFTATNAIVFAQYFLTAMALPISSCNQTVAAVSAVLISTGVIKIISMTLNTIGFYSMVITGLVVLLGLTSISDPYANFRQPFKGSNWSLNNMAVAFIKSNHAFIGWHNAFYLVGEIKGTNPIPTIRKSGRMALLLVSALFLFVNIAYVAAIPYDELKDSGSLVAVSFFSQVYGPRSLRYLPLLVSMSCFGNMARIIREVARQGLLPYPSFFSSIKPFSTPIGPICLKGAFTVLVILTLPAKDAFNFMVDLASYPAMFFQSLLSLGIWRLRRRRPAGVSPSPFQAKNWAIAVYFASCVLLLVLPWVPPPPGQADVSFWYATYCVVGIALLLACGVEEECASW
ncbi:amino acid/polyamine transporter I [Panaeolus papilionaceus]|nr:amino acid/polyamine transporter I [Panaeolus papilionaceus]